MQKTKRHERNNERFAVDLIPLLDLAFANKCGQILFEQFKSSNKQPLYEELPTFWRIASEVIKEYYPRIRRNFLTVSSTNQFGNYETIDIPKFLEYVYNYDYMSSSEICRISQKNAIIIKDKLTSVKLKYEENIRKIPRANDNFANELERLINKKLVLDFERFLKQKINNSGEFDERMIIPCFRDFIKENYNDTWKLIYLDRDDEYEMQLFWNNLFSADYSNKFHFTEQNLIRLSTKLNQTKQQVLSYIKDEIKKSEQKEELEKQVKLKDISRDLIKGLSKKGYHGITRSQLIAFLIETGIPESSLTELYNINIWVDFINDKLGFSKSVKLNQRKPLPPGIRYEVFKRDNYKCVICGRGPPDVTLHVDHIIPVSRGGKDTLDNLRTLCDECNLNKKDLIQ